MIKIGIIGVGGFAADHLGWIADYSREGLAVLEAAVIRDSDKDICADTEKELREKQVRIYRKYEEMYQQEAGTLDLISIPTGIDQHKTMSESALLHGYNVICEKPAAGTVEECRKMMAAAGSSGRFLGIGYQNIFSDSIQRIKEIQLSGKLGKLISAKTWATWPRFSNYYERTPWAGKIKINGKYIYDSPIMNAMAHFLQNMLYIAGPIKDEASLPVEVYGENYRAKDIESADTQYLRVKTAEGIVIQFAATHAATENKGPVTIYTFEKGKIKWKKGGESILYEGAAGNYTQKETFDNNGKDINKEVYSGCIRAIKDGSPPLCTIENSWQHVACVNSMFQSSEGVNKIVSDYLKEWDAKRGSYSPGPNIKYITNAVITDIQALIQRVDAEEKSFAELGVPWAKAGKVIKTRY